MRMACSRLVPAVLLLLAICAAAAAAADSAPPADPAPPSGSTPAAAAGAAIDPWRLLLGVHLSTDDFSLDAVGESTNLGVVAFFEADILPFLSLGANAWLTAVEARNLFDADSRTVTAFPAFGVEILLRAAVWQRDYVVPTQRVVRRERVSDDWERIWYYMEDVPHHGGIGIFAAYPLSFDPSSPAQLTPLSALVIGAWLETRQAAIYDGMRLQLSFQRTSTALPLAESLRVGGQFLAVGQPVFLSVWVEGYPFAETPAAVPVGMSVGFALDWR